MIDNTSCINAVNTIKNYVGNCFDKCSEKGSTFSGTEKLSNLESAIDLIPTNNSSSGGVISENITGGTFTPFTITLAQETENEWGELITTDEFTIDFGSVGVTWKSFICYSDTNEGHFGITKMPNNKCVISAVCFYDASNEWEEASGVYCSGRGTYRATYQIMGNSIIFTNDEYDATGNLDFDDEFRALITQVSNYENNYFTNQYKLDKITVCV